MDKLNRGQYFCQLPIEIIQLVAIFRLLGLIHGTV